MGGGAINGILMRGLCSSARNIDIHCFLAKEAPC